jgi:Holliday junction resolvase
VTNHYARGSDFERAIKAALEDDGYFVVRSAGSKGKVDLVAVKPGQLLFVQAKINGLCPPAERAELLRVAARAEALPIVAYKGTEGRRRPIRYRLLTGPGPKEFIDWTPDYINNEEKAV